MALVTVVFLALCALHATSASVVETCSDDIFADPDTCDHFYKCDNGKPVLFTCPDNLFYNTATKVCDWPNNVKCDANTGQRPGDGSSSKQDTNTDQSNNNQGGQGNGKQQQTSQSQSGTTNNNVSDDEEDGRSWYSNLQTPDAEDPNVAPNNVAAPPEWDGEERARLTVDDLYTVNNNPYAEEVKRELEQ